jgi:hypothetical protein
MIWEVRPEPPDPNERGVLLSLAEDAVAGGDESAWWRSGLDDLGGGPAPEQAWGRAGVIET